MQGKFGDTGFARLYLWSASAKYTMGIYFLVFVFLYLFLGFASAGPAATLDFFTAMQMAVASLLIGLGRQGIVPGHRLTRPRGILWMVLSIVVTVAFGLVFEWFSAFPGWCLPAFLAIVTLCGAAALLGQFFELYRETRQLNRQLEQYQRRTAQEEIPCQRYK